MVPPIDGALRAMLGRRNFCGEVSPVTTLSGEGGFGSILPMNCAFSFTEVPALPTVGRRGANGAIAFVTAAAVGPSPSNFWPIASTAPPREAPISTTPGRSWRVVSSQVEVTGVC